MLTSRPKPAVRLDDDPSPSAARAADQDAAARTIWHDARARISRNPLVIVGGASVLLFALLAIFAPFLAPYDPAQQHLGSTGQAPGAAYPLGTDALGRDLLSRLLWGARISMSVGVF